MYSRNATRTVRLRHFLRWRGVETGHTEWVFGPVDPSADNPSSDITRRPLAAEIDLMFSAETPLAVTSRKGAITRYFTDPRAVDGEYFAVTGIFPPQHVIILRRSFLERTPWIAGEIEAQFTAAERLFLDNQAHNPFGSPCEALEREAVAALMGARYFRHGLAANRPVLQAFIDTVHAEGLIWRAIAVEDLFGLSASAT